MTEGTVLSIFGRDPSYVGGIELYARELSRQLGEQGWQSVMAFSAPPSGSVARLLDFPSTRVEVLPETCALKPGSVAGFLRLIRKHRPEIVHMHFTPLVGPYPWAARLRGVSEVVLTDHSSRPAGHVIRRASARKRLAWRTLNAPVSRVICVSRFGLRCLQGLDVMPPNRLCLVYNSVDIDRAKQGGALRDSARRRFGIASDRTVIAQVSWMIPEKGWRDLLAAAARVLESAPNAHFLMVGDGPDRPALQRMAEESGIADRVTWTGNVDDPLGTGVFAAADIVCQVSRWQELFGFAIAEGMAAGKPVVGTRTGGIPELIQDGETGFLIEPGDVEALACRLLELVADGSLRDRLGRAGHESAACRFDLRTNVAQLLDVYGLPRRQPDKRACLQAPGLS